MTTMATKVPQIATARRATQIHMGPATLATPIHTVRAIPTRTVRAELATLVRTDRAIPILMDPAILATPIHTDLAIPIPMDLVTKVPV